MKKLLITAVTCGIVALFSTSALAQTDWNVKIALQKHDLTLTLGNPNYTLDGKAYRTPAPIIKNDSTYMPVKALEKTDIQLYWNNQEKYVDAFLPQNNLRVRYTKGENNLKFINSEGKVIEKKAIPTPFIQGGRIFIPVKEFQNYFAKNLSVSSNKIKISWTKSVLTNNLPKTIDKSELTLKVLYEQPLLAPTILQSIGIGAMSGSAVSNIQEVVFDGKRYNLGKYNLKLDPGTNIIGIDLMKGNSKKEYITLHRDIKDTASIPIKYFEDEMFGKIQSSKEFFEVTAPNSGYIKVKGKKQINFEAFVKKDNIGDNVFELYVGKYVNNQLVQKQRIKMPVKSGKCTANFELEEKGSYVVDVISPRYITAPGGPVATKWAEFYIEID